MANFTIPSVDVYSVYLSPFDSTCSLKQPVFSSMHVMIVYYDFFNNRHHARRISLVNCLQESSSSNKDPQEAEVREKAVIAGWLRAYTTTIAALLLAAWLKVHFT